MDPGAASIGSAVIGTAGNMFMSNRANHQAMAQADRAMKHEADQYAHRYQTTVEDMRKAGLNPAQAGAASVGGGPSGQAAPVQTPQIEMPQIVEAMRLNQDQQRIDIDKANSAAGIAKSLSEQDLNKMKKILYQKGMIRADLEGEASGVLKNMIKFMKDSFKMPKLPKNQKELFDNINQGTGLLP